MQAWFKILPWHAINTVCFSYKYSTYPQANESSFPYTFIFNLIFIHMDLSISQVIALPSFSST